MKADVPEEEWVHRLDHLAPSGNGRKSEGCVVGSRSRRVTDEDLSVDDRVCEIRVVTELVHHDVGGQREIYERGSVEE